MGATIREVETLPMFPLPGVVLFPGAVMPMHIFEPRYQDLLRDVLEDRGMLALAQLEPGYEGGSQDRPEVHAIMGVGQVVDTYRLPDGRANIIVRGLARGRRLRELASGRRYREIELEVIGEPVDDGTAASDARKREVLDLAELVFAGIEGAGAYFDALRAAALGRRLDLAAAAVCADPAQRQQVLEALDLGHRFALVTDRMKQILLEKQSGKVLN